MTLSAKIRLAVVIPVYGSGSQLPRLWKLLESACRESSITLSQLILIDDCGPGDAWEVITGLAATDDRIQGIQLMRNFGQHNALMCGFHQVTSDVVVTMDDDLQHDPASVPVLVQALLQTRADLVYGVYASKRHTYGRNLGSWLVNRFYRIVFRMPVTVTAFRAVRRELVEAILRYDLNFTYIDGLLAWNTQRIGMVEVPHCERQEGRSGYTFTKLIALAMNVFTNFSLLPLQLVSLLGFLAAAGGLTLGAFYLLVALLSRVEVPGYASLIVAVLTLGGFQMLSLGILGEYLGRLHLNVNRKPQFSVRRMCGGSKSPL